jgi:hypothetical protein
VTEGRGRNPRPCRSPTLLAAAVPDPVPAAAAVADPATGAPQRAWRSQPSLKGVLRNTGLLSHSAAPLLQLAALRLSRLVTALGWCRPPSGVSAACRISVACRLERPFPGSPTWYCAHQNSNARGKISARARPRVSEVVNGDLIGRSIVWLEFSVPRIVHSWPVRRQSSGLRLSVIDQRGSRIGARSAVP